MSDITHHQQLAKFELVWCKIVCAI